MWQLTLVYLLPSKIIQAHKPNLLLKILIVINNSCNLSLSPNHRCGWREGKERKSCKCSSCSSVATWNVWITSLQTQLCLNCTLLCFQIHQFIFKMANYILCTCFEIFHNLKHRCLWILSHIRHKQMLLVTDPLGYENIIF